MNKNDIKNINMYDIEKNKNSENYKQLCLNILSCQEQIDKNNIEKYNETVFSSKKIQELISELTEIEQEIINKRFGLNNEKNTLAEISKTTLISTDKIRIIEANILRKLKFPSNLKSFYLEKQDMEEYKIDDILNDKKIFYECIEKAKNNINLDLEKIEKLNLKLKNFKKEVTFKNKSYSIEMLNLNKKEKDFLDKKKIKTFKSLMRIKNVNILIKNIDKNLYKDELNIIESILDKIENQVKYDENNSLSRLKLSKIKYQKLKSLGIETIEDLTNMTKYELSLYMSEAEIINKLEIIGKKLINEEEKVEKLKNIIKENKDIKKIRITELNLNRKTYRYLESQGINTLYKLLEFTENEINTFFFNEIMNECDINQSIRRAEKLSNSLVKDIQKALNELGLQLKNTNESPKIKYTKNIIKNNPNNISEVKIWQLDFKPTTYFQLKKYNIETLNQLLNLKEEDLKYICIIERDNCKEFSQLMYNEIIDKLKIINYNEEKKLFDDKEKQLKEEIEKTIDEKNKCITKYNLILKKEKNIKSLYQTYFEKIDNVTEKEKLINLKYKIKNIEQEIEQLANEKKETLEQYNILSLKEETYLQQIQLFKDDIDKKRKNYTNL